MHTILIIEDHPMMVDAIKASIQGLPIKTHILTASSLNELRGAPRLRTFTTPSLIIADLNLTDSQGLSTLHYLRAYYPDSPIFVFSQIDDPSIAKEVMATGAVGLVLKSDQPKVFVARLRAIIAEVQAKLPVCEVDACAIVDQPQETLTVQQRKVLSLLATGQSNIAIGRQLEVSEATIRAHLSEIYRRLGVKNRTQATVQYLDWASQREEV